MLHTIRYMTYSTIFHLTHFQLLFNSLYSHFADEERGSDVLVFIATSLLNEIQIYLSTANFSSCFHFTTDFFESGQSFIEHQIQTEEIYHFLGSKKITKY